MIVGSDKLIEWVKANESPYWRIMHSEKGGVIIQSNTAENLTVSDSIPRLEDALKMISSGTYFVDAWHQGQNQNSRFKTRFILNQGDNIGSFNSPQSQSISDVQEQITKALNEYKRDLENERLKQENEELKNEVNSSTYRILNRLEPYLGGMIEAMFPNVRAISGTQQSINQSNNPNTVEVSQDEQNRLDNALSDWSEKDPDLVTLIEEVAKLAKNDPAKYQMAKSLLMKK